MIPMNISVPHLLADITHQNWNASACRLKLILTQTRFWLKLTGEDSCQKCSNTATKQWIHVWIDDIVTQSTCLYNLSVSNTNCKWHLEIFKKKKLIKSDMAHIMWYFKTCSFHVIQIYNKPNWYIHVLCDKTILIVDLSFILTICVSIQ